MQATGLRYMDLDYPQRESTRSQTATLAVRSRQIFVDWKRDQLLDGDNQESAFSRSILED
jgi:hypothetical protein